MRHYLSIPTRIFLAFTLVLVLFGTVSGFGLIRHQRSASTLRLLHAGYLPLTLSVGEARASQAVFSTLLDRLLDDGESIATQNWIRVALRVRPVRIRRAIEGVNRVARLNPSNADQALLRRVHAQLVSVQQIHDSNAPHFEELFQALAANNPTLTSSLLSELRTQEHRGQRQIRYAWASLQEHMASISMQADDDEQQALIILGLSSLLVLLIGASLMWWANRLLAPLPHLQRRVEAVTRGEFQHQSEAHSRDELGSLAETFERMVETLAERDRSLRETTNKLVQSEQLAAIGRLAAQVTHEVRNPLSSIGLNVELLEEDLGVSNPETKQLLNAIKHEIDRLAQITEKYLSLKRLPSPEFEDVEVDHLIASIIDFVRPDFEKTNIFIETTTEGSSGTLRLDAGQIRQALLNLLRNSREAMPQGGHIHIRQIWHPDRCELQIQDEGQGMDEATIKEVFSPFFTTKESGTGLGLPLTQQIVVAHGGHIACTSVAGSGTTFTLSLPCKKE